MQHARPTSCRRSRGFTLTELLVAISIIMLLIGITFPVISAMQSGSRIEAGMNTIGMSADVARQWVAPSAWSQDSEDKIENEVYSGTAAIYCPTGEIRIVMNFRNAADPAGRPLEDMASTLTSLAPNGYRDRIGVDYISIPSGVGVAGVYRDNSGVRFIAPPFAIAFNESGQLYFGDVNGRIYYDSDGKDGYEILNRRANSYDPDEWDGSEASPNNSGVISDALPVREIAPFEAIECVPGVVIYDTEDFKGAGYDFAGGGSVDLNSDAGQWLQENGQTLFFSPHTGVALRDEQE